MELQGQGGERGYAMAALLVSLAVMGVLMTAALPAWKHLAQREKEAELVFRGEQYARAVALYRAKNGNAFPPSVDVLVQGKYLRKKYLDPITGKEFDVIGAATAQLPPGGQAPQVSGRGRGRGQPPGAPIAQPPAGFTSTVSGGIMGVHSKSEETSIRSYKGQTRYDQWIFVFTVAERPGGAAPGALNPGGRGGLPTPGPGGRGRPPAGRGDAPGRGLGAPGGFGLPVPPALPRGAGAGSM